MILIFSSLISLVVSLVTCFVFFRLAAKKKVEEKTPPVSVTAESVAELEEEYFLYPSEPIKDYAFNNFFTDDPAFLDNMKSMLDDYSSSTPIILRGTTGIGKTHLMHAFENYLLEKEHLLKTYYISAEAFTFEFIESMKNHKINQFKEKYRNLDALFIDDLNYLRNRESTQEELFYTLSRLLEKKAFICFGVTTPFSFKEGFSDRFISLINGAKIDVPIPGFESKRRKIMEIFSKSKCYVNSDLVDFLANPNISLNEVVGLCQRLIIMKQLEGKGCVNLKIEEIKIL